MTFQAIPLARSRFDHLFGLSESELAGHRARRVRADASPGYPCRISLRDAAVGETLLLVNFEHQDADSPFRSSHAVYVQPGAAGAELAPDVLPPYFAGRAIALRAFDAEGMIVGAELVDGERAAPAIEALLANPDASYIHAHFAKFGCYAARIDRA